MKEMSIQTPSFGKVHWLGEGNVEEALPEKVFGRHFRTLKFLEKETNPILLSQSLCALARRLEADDLMTGAAQIYGYLAESPEPVPQSIRRQARERLALFNGESTDSLAYAEFIGSRFIKSLRDPSTIGSFALGGVLGEAVQFFATRRLLSLTPGLLTRGLMGRSIAGLGGIFGETIGLILGGQAALLMTSHAPKISSSNLIQLGLTSLIFSGSMRTVSGAVNDGVSHLIEGSGIFELATRAIAPKLGLLGGVSLAHGIETHLGFRKEKTVGMFIAESLAATMQVMGVGAIAGEISGLSRLNCQMKIESLRLWNQSFLPSLPQLRHRGGALLDRLAEGLFGPGLSWSYAGGPKEGSSISNPEAPSIPWRRYEPEKPLLMETQGGSLPSKPIFRLVDAHGQVRQSYQPPLVLTPSSDGSAYDLRVMIGEEASALALSIRYVQNANGWLLFRGGTDATLDVKTQQRFNAAPYPIHIRIGEKTHEMKEVCEPIVAGTKVLVGEITDGYWMRFDPPEMPERRVLTSLAPAIARPLAPGKIRVMVLGKPRDFLLNEKEASSHIPIGRQDLKDMMGRMDQSVSRTHIFVGYHKNQWFVFDNHSENGVFINDHPQAILPGVWIPLTRVHTLRLGNIRLGVSIDPATDIKGSMLNLTEPVGTHHAGTSEATADFAGTVHAPMEVDPAALEAPRHPILITQGPQPLQIKPITFTLPFRITNALGEVQIAMQEVQAQEVLLRPGDVFRALVNDNQSICFSAACVIDPQNLNSGPVLHLFRGPNGYTQGPLKNIPLDYAPLGWEALPQWSRVEEGVPQQIQDGTLAAMGRDFFILKLDNSPALTSSPMPTQNQKPGLLQRLLGAWRRR